MHWPGRSRIGWHPWRAGRGPWEQSFTERAIFTSVVKKPEAVNIQGQLGAEALRILRDIPGVTAVTAEPRPPDGRRPDAIIEFAGRAEKVIVEVKRHANAATAWQVIEYAKTIPGAGLLLVAGDTTRGARDILERHGVGVVDGLGNAHVELPGLLLHIEGDGRPRRGEAGAPPPARLSGKAGVAAQALLLDPVKTWQIRDLAETAGISTGLAHRVLTRLEGEGVVIADGTGPRRVRRLTNRAVLLDLWVEENRDRRVQRSAAFRLAPTPRQLGDYVAGALDHAGIDYALTGSYVAAQQAPYITAVPVVDVWISNAIPLEDALRALDAEPVETGHNVMLRQVDGDAPLAFHRNVEGSWRVNDFRLYYDLRNDPRRGKEQAERLREKVIGF